MCIRDRFNTYHSEHEMLRYMRSLADKDLAMDRTMIPLGSCTMTVSYTHLDVYKRQLLPTSARTHQRRDRRRTRSGCRTRHFSTLSLIHI